MKDFYDNYYPSKGYTQIRNSVRGLVYNDKGELGMIHLVGEDIFGLRDHFETPGGQIEKGESHQLALQREIEEELGYACEVGDKITTCIIRYNPLSMISVNHYYLCYITKKKSVSLTDLEQSLFQDIQWHSLETWKNLLNKPRENINAMLHQRELYVIEQLEKHLKAQ